MQYHCGKCGRHTDAIHADGTVKCPECGGSLAGASITPGTVIAGFKILKEIGRGANGVVYLARQVSLERDVALKILPEEKVGEPGFVDNFFREARAAARLNHQNIVQAYDAGVTGDGIYFFAMELISGKTVEHMLNKHGALEFNQALDIGIAIAEALAYAWDKQKLTHGDIKPDNIILNKDGEAKLADLGLAKSAFEEKSDEIMATPMYAPPEIIKGEKDKIGIKSDMYSFGVTMYEMCAGEPPFNEPDPQLVLQLHLSSDHLPLITKIPGFNSRLSLLIDRLLAKNMEKRPDSWHEVIDFLHAVKHHAHTAPKGKTRILNYSIAVVAVLSGLLLCGTAAGIWYFVSQMNQPEEEPKTPVAIPVKTVQVSQPIPSPRPKVLISVPAPKKKPVLSSDEVEKIARLRVALAAIPAALTKDEMAKQPSAQLETLCQKLLAVLLLCENDKFLRERATEKRLAELKAMLIMAEKNVSEQQKQIKLRRVEKLQAAMQADMAERQKRENAIVSFRNANAANARFYAVLEKFNELPAEDKTSSGLKNCLKGYSSQVMPPENSAIIKFLQEQLPAEYNIVKLFLVNGNRFIGMELPWNIDGNKYKVTEIDPEFAKVTTQLSESAYIRHKIKWSSLSSGQFKTLIEHWVINKKIKLPGEQNRMLAAWLLVNDENALLERLLSQKFFSEQTNKLWRECQRTLSTASKENSATTVCEKIIVAIQAHQYPAVIAEVAGCPAVCKTTSSWKKMIPLLDEYLPIAENYSPEMQAGKIVEQMQQCAPDALFNFSAIAFARYSLLNAINTEIRQSIKEKYQQARKQFKSSENYDGNFGIINILPAGSVWQWVSAEDSTLRQLPGIVDAGNWQLLNRMMTKKEYHIGAIRKQPESWQLPILYNLGLAAIWFQDKDLQEQVLNTLDRLSLQKNAPPELRQASHLLMAKYAIKTGNYSMAIKLLDSYVLPQKLEPKDLIIPILKLTVMLQDLKLDEPAFEKTVEHYAGIFAKSAKKSDIALLKTVTALVRNDHNADVLLSEIDFKTTACPQEMATLLADAAARGIYLERSNIPADKIFSLLQPVTADSIYAADLWYRLAILKAGLPGTTPRELAITVNNSLADWRLSASPAYPSLMLLKFYAAIMNNELSASQTSGVLNAFLRWCPIFSMQERYTVELLKQPAPAEAFKAFADQYPFTSKLFFMGLVTVASETARNPADGQALLNQFNVYSSKLLWQERLLLRSINDIFTAATRKLPKNSNSKTRD
ncbi:MAG: protein kinase [Victivallaceae bacterium]